MNSIADRDALRPARRWGRFAAAFLTTLASVLFASFPIQAQAQQADLVVNQADSPDPGYAGQVFTYTIRVDNNGPNTASNVQLVDVLPPGAIFQSATPASCGESGGTVTCNLGNLAFSASTTVTIMVKLPEGTPVNTVSATSATPDPNTSNNLNITEQTTVNRATDMSVAVSVPSPVDAGAPYSYTVVARNQGPTNLSAGQAQTISFAVPTGACITAVPTGTGWSCTPNTGFPRCSGTISCSRSAALAANADAPALTVPAVANVGGSVTASFQVSSALPESIPADNTVVATTNVSGNSSDVSIVKTRTPATVALGANVTYTLTPRHNGGVAPVAPITVTDVLPAGLTLMSQPTGTGWSCTPNAGFPIPGPVTVTCTRSTAYTGGNFTDMPAITLVARVDQVGAISNTAAIDLGPTQTDPVPANNQSTIGITGSNDADLSMTKTASISPVVPGQNFNYTLTVRNGGPVIVPSTTTITVTDTIPGGVELRAAPTGTGWTCSTNIAPPYPIPGPVTVTCTRPGTLNVNANAPAITLPVVIPAVEDGEVGILNTACAAMNNTSDPNATNNCNGVAVRSTSAQADLGVSKTALPASVRAGQDLTYTITVANAGPDPATDVQVTDALANLLGTGGFQSATPSQGTCTPNVVTNGPTVNLSCDLGPIAVGATATVTLVVRPVVATTANRTNTVTVNSLTVGDPDRANNSASVTSQVTAVADVRVTKTPTPNPVQAGTPLTYVLTARNDGPSTASTVQVVDTLPGNVVFLSMGAVTGSGSCTSPAPGSTGGTITCNWASINNNSQQTATFVVRPVTGATSVVNQADITTTTEDLNLANNTFSLTTPVNTAEVDILVNKVDSIDPVALGQSTVYTVTVTNAGPSHATNVQLVDTFPDPGSTPTATFSYQGALTITPPGSGSCTEPSIDATSGVIGCSFPQLANGASVVVTYEKRAIAIASGISGTTFNHARVSAAEPETRTDNNETTHATTSRRTADLAIVKTAPPTFTPGMPFSWTLTVTNNGPNESVGALVTDTLPSGVTFQSASPGCSNASGPVICTLGTLASGASTAFTITVLPGLPYTGADPLVNTASVATLNEVDPVDPNNTSSVPSTPATPQADVSLVKAGPATVPAGGAITWLLTIGNAGPAAANGATWVDTLPAGVTGVTASCAASGGAVCGPVNVGAGSVDGSMTTFPAGSSAIVTLQGTAPSTGPLENTASITPPPGTVDPNTGNNNGSSTTTLVEPDLTIVKVANGTFALGQVGATYTLTVSNVGGAPTSGTVTVVDPLPAGLTPTAASGTGWSCNVAAPSVSCTRADALATAASYPPITITVNVASNAPSSVTNTGTVSGGGETNTSNNASTVTTPLAPLPDVTIVKVANGSFTPGQVGATYTLTVSNVGGGATSGTVSVTDTLPAGLTATAIAGTGWSCVLATLTCTRSDPLDAGANYPPITLTVDVSAGATGSLVNTANVSGGGETNTSNNTSTVTTPLGTVPNLTIVKVANGTFTLGQAGATYTLTVSNVGGGATTGAVTVTDTLPAGLTATAIAGTGWSCVLATLTCTRSDPLDAGASYPPITLTVDVAQNANSPIVNVANVSGGSEVDPSNNSSSASTPLLPQGGPSAPEQIPVMGIEGLALMALLLALLGWVESRRRGGRIR